MNRTTVETSCFFIALALVSGALVWILLPFYGAILWALILAILFRPLYLSLLRRTGQRRNLAAAMSLLACVVIVIVPGAIVLDSMIEESQRLYSRAGVIEIDIASTIRNLWTHLPDFVIRLFAWVGLTGPDEFHTLITDFIGQVAQSAADLAVRLGQSTVQLAISLGIMLYTLFFLFRDGPALITTFRRASPLSQGHTDKVLAKLASAVRATIKGNVIIAILQGALGGVIFWLLGIQAALLWAALMSLLALLPVVGAALVWVPFAIYLLIAGQTAKGVTLLVFGALVISLVDNLLRPALVGRDLRLPDFVVLVTTVGGIALIGPNGFVIGPMIAALFVAIWSSFAEEKAKGKVSSPHDPA
ncbi:AI-2E family transporter [Tabrizicola sp. J26]|uniref:AI-2E family transporter n=1 Tax=Alitabrizicola rongguiensis TaxID=2909234 RepID=UPI001F15E9DC|nr:AI-2E family transporter [Tabrizicola rongguiensis]MCF1708198.1 AI-2E family transporter [Tabrizicola rongguiensis]